MEEIEVKAPTYEEFRDIVWGSVLRDGKGWDAEDLKKYLEKEEDSVVYEYEKALKEYEAGRITYRQFTEGIPAAIAYELQMSY